jgi:hypothetical protein
LGKDCKREKDDEERGEGLWIRGQDGQIRKDNMANHVARRHILDSNHTKQEIQNYRKGKLCRETVKQFCFEIPQNVSIESCRQYINDEYGRNPGISVVILKG